MSTISVPLNAELTTWVESMVKQDYAENKASLVRKAEEEAREGKLFEGDLRELIR